MSSFFVTGTDTNVGKTIASRAIIQALQNKGIQIVGYKPIACGREEPVYAPTNYPESDHGLENNLDVLTLINSTHQDITYQMANSYTFEYALPVLTKESERININKINRDLEHLTKNYQSVLVEGAFGWLTPMNKTHTFADWVKEQNMPIVLVVGIKEGCINHTLLTVQAIQNAGLPLLGWIANRINPGCGHYAEIIELLTSKIDAPLLGKIPYIHKPEEQNLGAYITNIDRLSYMQTLS